MPNESLSQQLSAEIHEEAQDIACGRVDSLETNARYLAYFSRLKTALVTSSRYVAYSSDIGEAFRPVVSPYIVKGAYGLSWLYVGGDIAYEGYKANLQNKPLLPAMVERGVFQVLASMALPAFTIHTAVKYSTLYVFNNVKNAKAKTWGPTVVGLGIVPILPFLFDEPVEKALHFANTKLEKEFGINVGKGHKEL
ncbi:Mitochondrial fission process protein 1 [Neolecta irregularis DAH-3]|uniref:Mitochondrial fission process protein 1 n=1 Tax=Neolecta irregularis (strain DAH-3) TaxID=1198029 RepID=A0A1U7LJW8_NEOID|nr:Mitochondrial fission process protein 1 [Neolecta irregularis DAH-3]|eukprot:OLL22947.1 Mitochondrial fission process protein 1 [Neolecta irregularis DAH-3]